MDATLIVVDSDAELERAFSLVDRLMTSDDPADIARAKAQGLLIAAYEEIPPRPDIARGLKDRQIEPVKIYKDEGTSMLLRRAMRAETIPSDIALRLAEMVFVRLYGKEYVDRRSPLVVIDSGNRWDIRSHDGITPGERLLIVIEKANGRILDLANF